MAVAAGPIARLIQQFAKLPGVGEKTAARLAFHVLRQPPEEAEALANAILDVKQKIRFCSCCWNLTETDPCGLCSDVRRDRSQVCVVAYPQDVVALEKAGGYRGLYHVLHGVLSPLDGVGPDDLRVGELLRRCQSSAEEVTEVILATSPNVEGEATALYIAKLLKSLGLRSTRIATGVPMGGELEFADQVTLARAMEGRREL